MALSSWGLTFYNFQFIIIIIPLVRIIIFDMRLPELAGNGMCSNKQVRVKAGIRSYISASHRYPTRKNHTMSYSTIPYFNHTSHTIPCHTPPYHMSPIPIPPYHVIPHHTICQPYLSHHTMSYHTIPYVNHTYHTIPCINLSQIPFQQKPYLSTPFRRFACHRYRSR